LGSNNHLYKSFLAFVTLSKTSKSFLLSFKIFLKFLIVFVFKFNVLYFGFILTNCINNFFEICNSKLFKASSIFFGFLKKSVSSLEICSNCLRIGSSQILLIISLKNFSFLSSAILSEKSTSNLHGEYQKISSKSQKSDALYSEYQDFFIFLKL
jgi:hypothetical protein